MADETPEEPDDAQSPVLGSANGLGVLKEGWDEPMSDEEFEELFGQPIPDFLDAASARSQPSGATAFTPNKNQ